MINDILCSLFNPKEEVLPKEDDIFQLPIAYLEKKTVLEEHTITDLELLPPNPKDSLYKYVFKPDTVFGEKTMQLWSKYYTPDTTFLKESQNLLKSKMKTHVLNEESVNQIWQEIQAETGFAEKYSYVEWEKITFLRDV